MIKEFLEVPFSEASSDEQTHSFVCGYVCFLYASCKTLKLTLYQTQGFKILKQLLYMLCQCLKENIPILELKYLNMHD
jgi:hypothetical protein